MGACTVSVLVVDNDPAGIVAELVTRTAPTHIPVRYVIEKQLGIAAARQRVLDESSGADLLQFVDDDEVPDPHWLRRMVAAWIDFAGPTAVAGVVRPDYQGRPERRCMGRPARQFHYGNGLCTLNKGLGRWVESVRGVEPEYRRPSPSGVAPAAE